MDAQQKLDETKAAIAELHRAGVPIPEEAYEIRDLCEAAILGQKASRLEQAIREEIALLEKWANDSLNGGWSTHLVDAHRKRADELRRVLIP